MLQNMMHLAVQVVVLERTQIMELETAIIQEFVTPGELMEDVFLY